MTKEVKMNEAALTRLKKIPPTRCTKCKSVRSYTNPMEKCYECKRKFCFDHIQSLQINDKMNENTPVRCVCPECIPKHGYRTL